MSMLLIWNVACSINCFNFQYDSTFSFNVNGVQYRFYSSKKRGYEPEYVVASGGTKGATRFVRIIDFKSNNTLHWHNKTQNVNACVQREDTSDSEFKLLDDDKIVLSTFKLPVYVPSTIEQLNVLKQHIVQKNWNINPYTVKVYDDSDHYICDGFKVEASHVISNCSLKKPHLLKDNMGNIFTVDSYEEAEAKDSSHYKVMIIKIKEQFKLNEIIAFDEKLPPYGDRIYQIYKIDEHKHDLVQIEYSVNNDDTLQIKSSQNSSPIVFEVKSIGSRNYLLVSAIKIKPEIYLSTEYLRLTFELYMQEHNREIFKFVDPTILTKENADQIRSSIELNRFCTVSCGLTLSSLRLINDTMMKLTAILINCPYNQEYHRIQCLNIDGQKWTDHTAFIYQDLDSHDLMIIDPSYIMESPFKLTQVNEIYHTHLVSINLTATGADPTFSFPNESKFLYRIYLYTK